MKPLVFLVATFAALATSALAQNKFPTADELQREFGAKTEMRFDQPYAATGNPKQLMDVFLPKTRVGDKPLPVILYIHGGGWSAGDRKRGAKTMAPLAGSGRYVTASMDYRLSQEAPWPAQIHDCKAAIRWIRGHAAEWRIDPERIAVWGGSAGGHLCSMLGVSGGVKELEGSLGEFSHLSSRVTCVVNFCGPSDLTAPLYAEAAGKSEDTAVAGLLGGPLADKREVAIAASPLTYVTPDDAPFFTAHGTEDQRVQFVHAVKLDAALKEAGVPSLLVPVTGGGHGFNAGPELDRRIEQFLDLRLHGIPSDIATTPIPTQTPRKTPGSRPKSE